jgi:hypothetical protein
MLPHTRYPEFKKSFLYNLRNGDFQQGGRISKGEVVRGKAGYVVAEESCPDWSATTVSFRPNRKCDWKEFKSLPCMTHPDVPRGKLTKKALRHRHYVVVSVTSKKMASLLRKIGVRPVVTGGKEVVNLEISTFQAQGAASPRRATLLP